MAVKEVMEVPNQIIDAADKLIEQGMSERISFEFTLFGRTFGVDIGIKLLHKADKKPN